MKKNKRVLGLSALVGLGLMAAGSAQAYEMTIGGFDVQIDTTTSFGMSMLTADTDTQFLPTGNGGPADLSTYLAPVGGQIDLATGVGTPCGVGSITANYGEYCQAPLSLANFDGAINSDDGRLNFNRSGDLISAPVKITSDIMATRGNITAFARVNAFYDAVLMDDSSFNRTGVKGGLSDRGESNAGYDLQLLDAYLSFDLEVADRPLMVRIGKQVINWGEATFIPGGNSAFNPIDVGAIRRPGAEIKEALLPVEAVYASLALTDSITVEAYYGGWDEYKLDVGGTAFASSDAFVQGTLGGNEDVYWIGGGSGAGQRFPCDSAGLTAASMTNTVTIANAIQSAGVVDCAATPLIEVKTGLTSNSEFHRASWNDHTDIKNGNDVEGDEAIGLALRWYAENLNSTEFAFYYQKMDSRLPYISYRTTAPNVTYTTIDSKADVVGRGAVGSGCATMLGAAPLASFLLGSSTGQLYMDKYNNVAINDPDGLMSNSAISNLALAGISTATSGAQTAYASNAGTFARLQEMACGLFYEQRTLTTPVQGGAAAAYNLAGQLPTGAINLASSWELSLQAEFPEVETYGFSFNTTLAGWGVQGDFSYRPNVPLQIDTDVLTVTSLFHSGLGVTAGPVENAYIAQDSWCTENGGIGVCSLETGNASYTRGWVDDYDAYTWNIGTTATFTQSNPVVAGLGASLGVFLTEFQGLYVPDAEDRSDPTGSGLQPLVNTCTSGSDLPLNGVLGIDDRRNNSLGGSAAVNLTPAPIGYCRPTDVSGGMVLMGQLQYNNVLGTPISVKPTLIVSHGLQGMSPSPIGQWRQGVGSAALSFNFEYLSKWQASLAYRAYHGPDIRTKNKDRDHVSVSVSYAF
ncbi:DUF1302 domain-containing protein [Alphaproteobacteria bacterium]|nr:DUF1302 domain-containing protein [Alphaproteobacteria bacterium]